MYHWIKPALDRLLAALLSIVLSPLLLLPAVLAKLSSPGPELFRQQRVDRDKKLFSIFKFRTMRTNAPKDTPSHLLQNVERYIALPGRFMRAFRLDGLPQLFNLLRGEMAIVGPRPAPWNQHDLIAECDKQSANAFKPCMTGWAQVNGRGELPIAVKAAPDGEYARRMSFSYDCLRIWRTIGAAITRNGIREGTVSDKKGDSIS